MIDWNRPLVAGVGEPLAIERELQSYDVTHADGEFCHHEADGGAYLFGGGELEKYRLRNRPWRGGDRVVTLDGKRRGSVKDIEQARPCALPVFVRFDDGVADWFTLDGLFLDSFDKDRYENIRYDYSRASNTKEKTEQDEPYKPWSYYGYDPGTRDPHAELEALIADALDAHESETQEARLLRRCADEIEDARAMPRQKASVIHAANIIAMVREHDAKQRPAREHHIEGITPTVPEGFIATGLTKDEFRNKLQAFANEWVRLEVERFSVGDDGAEKRLGPIIDTTPDPDDPFHIRCNVDAIEMFAEERERAVAKARREALEEAAAVADGLRPEAGWPDQATDDWECGCVGAARMIRALINKESADD